MDKEDIVKKFRIVGDVLSIESYGSGHINDTYLLKTKIDKNIKKYILQRINTDIFKEPIFLMENITNITGFLRGKIEKNGGDVNREVLNIIYSKTGLTYYKDDEDAFWRMYQFIEGAKTYDKVENKKDFYEVGLAFGNFQALLSDFDARILHETISSFHDTKKRFNYFCEVLKNIKNDRYEIAKNAIAFVLENDYLANVFSDMLEKGELPLRVTHNDTKLNNIMIDDETRKAICVIDLDTVMPGIAINDFGDSIRFGANKALEDEINLNKVAIDLDLFEEYAKGFLKAVKDKFTKKEIDSLCLSCLVMSYECGMRFLTDFLEGDIYFKISRENHNLDRAKCQFALVEDMKNNYEKMQKIIDKYR